MQVELPDGRELEVLVAGPADGTPLVFHVGTPSGAAAWPLLVETAAAAGLRTVTTSRPGYGRSTRAPGRRVADVAADTAAVLDHLGAEAFLTVGLSGGGPHALACAALLPARCRAAASVAGVAPFGADGLDFLAGMGPENHVEFAAALEGEAALTALLEPQSAELREVTAEELAASLGGLVPPIDVAALTGAFADWLAATLRSGAAPGPGGWVDDDLAFVAPWGFDLARIEVPVTIWQGDADLMVPASHGRWLAERVGGARAELRPGHGHLSLLRDELPRILAGLGQ